MKMQKGFRKGFTLVEMMIVVAIIAILAGIAIPEYTKYVMKSKAAESARFMKQIADAEVQYYSTHSGKYVNGDLGPLGVDIPVSAMFDYNVTTDTANNTCFTVYAVGKTGGDKDIEGKVISLVYPDKSATACKVAGVGATSTDAKLEAIDVNSEYWDGNLYFGNYYK
jgi:prepilin-type N-terminal cleavage/methylation domain-containing protein